MKKIALIYNYNIPYTTGNYLKKAFEYLNYSVECFLPKVLNKIPIGYNFYLVVDDGSHYFFPEKLRPSGFWVIDSHTAYKVRLLMAKRFDYVFVAQKDAYLKFKQRKVNAFWLPLACDPDCHSPKCNLPKKYDVSFIGSSGWGKRKKILTEVFSNFENSYFGKAEHTKIGEIYGSSKIVFNCGVLNDLNMRVFEGLCSGTCLITNSWAAGQSDLFKNGRELVEYSDVHEAIRLIKYYLNNGLEREKIAMAGGKKVLGQHTYRIRAEKIIAIIQKNLPKRVKTFKIMDVFLFRLLTIFYKFKYKFYWTIS